MFPGGQMACLDSDLICATFVEVVEFLRLQSDLSFCIGTVLFFLARSLQSATVQGESAGWKDWLVR
jgi:hypothetical protein